MVQEYLIGRSSNCWQLSIPHLTAPAGSSPFSDILYRTSPSIVFCNCSTIRQRIRFVQKQSSQDILLFDLYSFSKHCKRSLNSFLYRIFIATFICPFKTRADMFGWDGRTVEELWSLSIAISADWLLRVKVRDREYCIQYTFKAFSKRPFCLLISFTHLP